MKLGLRGLLAAVCVPPAAAQEYQLSDGLSMYDDREIQLDAITVRGAAFFTQNLGVQEAFSFGAGDEDLVNIAGIATNIRT